MSEPEFVLRFEGVGVIRAVHTIHRLTACLARLQKITTLSLLILAALWAAGFLHAGRPLWVGVGAVLIVFGYALFLAMEFVLLWFVRGDDPTPRPTAAQLF